MRFTSLAVVSSLLTVVSAHFRLQYPGPRGAFVANKEPEFCGGYSDVTTNRTEFPLSGGVISINAGHPKWTLGVIVSDAENPHTFDDFRKEPVVPFFATEVQGAFCIPFNFSSAGFDGAKDGANVTLQIVWDGGDGALYQCADLTLKRDAKVPDSVNCANASEAAVTPAPSPSQGGDHDHGDHDHGDDKTDNEPGSAMVHTAMGLSGLVSLVGVVMTLL